MKKISIGSDHIGLKHKNFLIDKFEKTRAYTL